MIAVVCLHTTHYFLNGESFYIAAFLYRSAVVAIPLFFMVSGYLLLGREDTNFRYSIKKIFGIIKFVFIITTTWWIITSVVHGDIQKGFLHLFIGSFVQRGTFSVFWYFGSMCIIYAIYPVINKLYRTRETVFYTLVIVLAVIQSIGFISNLTSIGESSICQTLRLWNWLTYFLLGGIIRKINYCSKGTLVTFVLIFLGINPFFQQWLIPYVGNDYCEYFYSSFLIVAGCGALFLCVKSLNIKDSKIIPLLSKLFLPVYALHKIIIMVLPPPIGWDFAENRLKMC